MDQYTSLMQRAIATCRDGIATGQSPFGAVVATASGNVIASEHNTVRASCDATAHAEINAIRAACRTLDTIDLSGHIMITTCEPCPMCAAAIHWARLDRVVYGASIADAAESGFHELPVSCRTLYDKGGSTVEVHAKVMTDACRLLFAEWQQGSAANPY